MTMCLKFKFLRYYGRKERKDFFKIIVLIQASTEMLNVFFFIFEIVYYISIKEFATSPFSIALIRMRYFLNLERVSV